MRILQVIILLFVCGCIKAQEIQFTAEAAPNILRVGEQFNLIYTSNQEIEDFDLPDIREFQILGGPSQGHSQSVTAVNGKITSTSTYQYTYFFRAVKEGKFTLPAASAKIKGKVYKSNPVNIEVLKASAPATPSHQGSGGNNATQSGQVSENDLYVRLVVDKTSAYLGEQIMATIKIYTRTNLASIDEGFKGPDFTGFFTEPLETPPLRSLQRENVNGDIYGTGVIRKMVIMPQRAGEITIGSFDLDVALRREVRRRYSDPFFDDFSIPDIQEIPVTLKSKPVKINVKPLPPNAPASFKGAVGSFRINASLSKYTTSTNDPLTLKVTVSGTGNIRLINDVQLEIPYDMEKFDPVINTRMDNAVSGTKTFEYMIMPKVAGKFTIPPVEFSYFDADAGQYKTLKTASFDVTVEKGPGDSLVATPGINQEDVRLLNRDIRFIKTKPGPLELTRRFIALKPWYYLLYILAIVLFFVIIMIRNRVVRQHADITGMRLRMADKYARKRLKKSENLLKQGNSAAFFEELLGAIWGYLSDKLSIPMSALSKDTARTALSSREVGDELIEQLFSIIDTCEMARYGFGTGEIDKAQLYHDAIKVITALQQRVRRREGKVGAGSKE